MLTGESLKIFDFRTRRIASSEDSFSNLLREQTGSKHWLEGQTPVGTLGQCSTTDKLYILITRGIRNRSALVAHAARVRHPSRALEAARTPRRPKFSKPF